MNKMNMMNMMNIILKSMNRLIFDKNRKRVKTCPCGKSNNDLKFAAFEGFDNMGYCFSCERFFYPDFSMYSQNNFQLIKPIYNKKFCPQKPIDYIPFSIYQNILQEGINLYNNNNFINWMRNPRRGDFAYDAAIINGLIETYFLGNWNRHDYKGWVLFPYIDIVGKLTDIKAIDYNPTTGKRIKKPYPKCHFIGKKILDNPIANTTRCFFGEHLLNGNSKPIMIFESEATATYVSPFFSEFVCLATGGKNGCKWTDKEKCKVLKGRLVNLYPDIDAHEEWEMKAEILRSYGLTVNVSLLIKNHAKEYAKKYSINYSELVKGKYDLRDILAYKRLSDFIAINPLTVYENWLLNNPEGGTIELDGKTIITTLKK